MMARQRPRRARTTQAGVTLIEVLVSMLLMSFGVLAMAAMQANALQYSKTSELRTLATLLANDLADRMRANHPASGAMSAYNLTAPYAVPSTMPGDADTACTGTAITCTFTQMAAYDLAEWRKQLYRHLPQGTGYVRTTGQQVDIWVAWTDPSAVHSLALDACPSGYGETGTVRCMYFRVAL